MRNDCFSPTEPVLKLPSRQNSPGQSLHCQHQRYEATTLQAARKQRGSKASQKLCKPSKGLERCRGSGPVSRTPIRPSNHPFQGDKLLPQWFSYRTFWYWQDKGVDRPEILLAEPEERHRELCLRIQCLSGFKSYLLQALWRLAVLTYTNLLIERPLHGLCDRLTVIHGLEKQQLRLDPCHCQPIDQDGALWASQSYYWYFGASKSYLRYGSSTSRSTRLNCDQLKLAFYLKILVIALLPPWHQTKTLNHILPSDRRSNQVAK